MWFQGHWLSSYWFFDLQPSELLWPWLLKTDRIVSQHLEKGVPWQFSISSKFDKKQRTLMISQIQLLHMGQDSTYFVQTPLPTQIIYILLVTQYLLVSKSFSRCYWNFMFKSYVLESYTSSYTYPMMPMNIQRRCGHGMWTTIQGTILEAMTGKWARIAKFHLVAQKN